MKQESAATLGKKCGSPCPKIAKNERKHFEKLKVFITFAYQFYVMDNLQQEILDNLKQQMTVIISQYELYKEENERLRIANESYRQELEKNKDTIVELKQKLERIQLVDAFRVSASDISEARNRVKALVREIDKCIALINE